MHVVDVIENAVCNYTTEMATFTGAELLLIQWHPYFWAEQFSLNPREKWFLIPNGFWEAHASNFTRGELGRAGEFTHNLVIVPLGRFASVTPFALGKLLNAWWPWAGTRITITVLRIPFKNQTAPPPPPPLTLSGHTNFSSGNLRGNGQQNERTSNLLVQLLNP